MITVILYNRLKKLIINYNDLDVVQNLLWSQLHIEMFIMTKYIYIYIHVYTCV